MTKREAQEIIRRMKRINEEYALLPELHYKHFNHYTLENVDEFFKMADALGVDWNELHYQSGMIIRDFTYDGIEVQHYVEPEEAK